MPDFTHLLISRRRTSHRDQIFPMTHSFTYFLNFEIVFWTSRYREKIQSLSVPKERYAPEYTVFLQTIRVVDARSGNTRLLAASANAPLVFSNVAALRQTASAAAACNGKCGQVTDLLVLSTKPNWIGGSDGTTPISWVLYRQGQAREERMFTSYLLTCGRIQSKKRASLSIWSECLHPNVTLPNFLTIFSYWCEQRAVRPHES